MTSAQEGDSPIVTRKKRVSMNFGLPVAPTGTPTSANRSSRAPKSAQTTPIPHSPLASKTPLEMPLTPPPRISEEENPEETLSNMEDNLFTENSSDNGHSASTMTSPSSTGTVSGSLTFDTYLSQLAAKERRVVEIRDEVKRLQETLKRAEKDLVKFREEAKLAFAPSVQSKRSSQEISSAGIEYRTLLDGDHLTPRSFKTSLFDRRDSTQLPPAGDVINMGKRVVEELGGQFWGFMDDIRNAALGDDARNHPHRQQNAPMRAFSPPKIENDQRSSADHPPTANEHKDSIYML